MDFKRNPLMASGGTMPARKQVKNTYKFVHCRSSESNMQVI